MIGVGVPVPLSTTFDIISLDRLDVRPDVVELVVSSQHLSVVQRRIRQHLVVQRQVQKVRIIHK